MAVQCECQVHASMQLQVVSVAPNQLSQLGRPAQSDKLGAEERGGSDGGDACTSERAGVPQLRCSWMLRASERWDGWPGSTPSRRSVESCRQSDL